MASDEIIECHMVAGGFDYLLKTRVADMEEYRRVLGDKIASIRGVRHTQTYFVLEEVKSTHALRIRGGEPAASGAKRARRGSAGRE
jgi:Lrp/AsnC family leucine-responsive transcriptional regulator